MGRQVTVLIPLLAMHSCIAIQRTENEVTEAPLPWLLAWHAHGTVGRWYSLAWEAPAMVSLQVLGVINS